MSEKIPILNLNAEESPKKTENKPLITEESIGYKLSEKEIRERRKIVEEAELSQRNRNEYRSNIDAAKEKIKKGELITSTEAGLLKAEETEKIEEEMAGLLAPEAHGDEKEIKKETFVSEKIADEALKKFNIKEDELKELESFGELSEGQQKIVLDNLRQLTLSRIQAEAAEKLSENNKKRGFISKFWQGAIGNKLQLANLEKEKAIEMGKGGVAIHGETLKQLIKGMREFGPEAENEKQINYISEKEFGSFNIAQKEALKKYNNIAAEYGKLPEEYGFESASKKNKARYDGITAKYKQAQENILPMLKEFYGGEKEAMLRVNKADLGVKMNQFIAKHPDVEKQLEGIKDNRWWKILRKNIAEKGAYGLAGAVARHATVGAFGYIGAPIAAAGMGAWLAYRRTKEEIRKNEILNRKGVKDESKTAKNFVKADTLITNIDRLVRKINEKGGSGSYEAELDELRKSLALRVKYTTDKLDKGLVDFGATEALISKTEEERKESEKRGVLGNRYFLVNKLSEAMVISNNNIAEQGKMEQRLAKFLNFQEKRISEAEQRHLIYQTLKGAGIAASFAAGGYLIRHFAGQWFGWDNKAEAAIKTSQEIRGAENAVSKGIRAMPESYPDKEAITINRGIPAMPESYPKAESVKNILGLRAELPPVVMPATEKLADILGGNSIKDSLAKILNYEVADADYKFSGGKHIVKDFYEKGFDLILKSGKGGKTMFGIDGPPALGKYNWGEEGKSWLFKPNAEFNEENLNKAVKFIKKAADTFYKGPSDYTKQGWSE